MIRQSRNHFVFIMEIPILEKMVFILRQAVSVYKDAILPQYEFPLSRQEDLTTILFPQWDF